MTSCCQLPVANQGINGSFSIIGQNLVSIATRLALATGMGCSSHIRQTPSAAALFVVVAEQ